MRHFPRPPRPHGALLALGLAALGVAAGCGRPGTRGGGNVVIVNGKVVSGSGELVQGSGKIVTDRVEVPGAFDAVAAEGAIEVTIVHGAESEITVETDDNLHALVRVRAESGTLHIGTEGGWTTEFGIKVKVTAPTLTGAAAGGAATVSADRIDAADGATGGKARIDASGASTLTVGEVRASSLRVRAEGASTVTVRTSATESLAIDAEGGSTVTLSGTCGAADVEASGASDVHAQGLTAKSADVETSGASTVDLDVTESLRADASGASTITYGGDAKVRPEASGASTIRHR